MIDTLAIALPIILAVVAAMAMMDEDAPNGATAFFMGWAILTHLILEAWA